MAGRCCRLPAAQLDDWRDSLAIAAALVRRPELQVGAAPEEAVWMLGSAIRNPQSAIRNRATSSAALPDTGYYVSRSAAGDHLVIDGGPHGYQNGGHAHADALSLTASARRRPAAHRSGHRLLHHRSRPARSAAVDGAPQHADARRSAAVSSRTGRSTGRRSRMAALIRWRTNERFDYFDGAHDGYRPIEHRRRVLVLHGDLVVVADLVDGAGAAPLPPCTGTSIRAGRSTLHGRRAELTRADRKAARVGFTVPQGLLEQFFGRCRDGPGVALAGLRTDGADDHPSRQPRRRRAVLDGQRLRSRSRQPGRRCRPACPSGLRPGISAHAAAIRIARATSVDHVLFAEPAAGMQTVEHAEPPGDSAAAGSTSAAVRRGLWRVGEVETDARMLFCRSDRGPADCGSGARRRLDDSRLRPPRVSARAPPPRGHVLRGRRRRQQRQPGSGIQRPRNSRERGSDMCGIAGFVESPTCPAPFGGEAATALVHRMCDVIRHRGPDDEGVWVDEGVALGMRRLSIIDLSTGHQPIHNEDRTVWIVFNGEIYNYRELRRELEAAGHRFYTSTDTEVIVHAYEQWGKHAIARLRGMFGLAIWDTRTRALLVARDRIGIKPMHYAARRRTALFRIGAEIAARGAGSAARSRPRRARSLPVVSLHAARRLDLQAACRSCRRDIC